MDQFNPAKASAKDFAQFAVDGGYYCAGCKIPRRSLRDSAGLDLSSGSHVRARPGGNLSKAGERNLTPLGGGGPSLGDIEFVYHQLTAPEIAAKEVDLSIPLVNLSKVSLTVLGGPLQLPGVDYQMLSATKVNWNGLGLDGLLVAGDWLFINYPS